MRRFMQQVMKGIAARVNRRKKTPGARRPIIRRLELEALEERSLLTTSPFGVITGTAFVDTNHNGVFNVGEPVLAGVSVRLSGTLSVSGPTTTLSASTKTNSLGVFTFNQVPPGIYKIDAGPTSIFLVGGPHFSHPTDGPRVDEITGITLVAGQTKQENVGFVRLSAAASSSLFTLRDYLSSTTTPGAPFAAPGTGLALVDHNPVLAKKNTQVFVAPGATNSPLDLAGFFTDPEITDQSTQIEFDTSIGATAQNPLIVDLFAKSAPQTVANFLDYVNNHNYDSSIFDRLAANFVLQGGTFNFDATNASKLVRITTLPNVPNEFGASNTKGTIAMAKQPSDPNSASDAFFFNLADNSSNLDHQNEGFTVFGKIHGATDQTVLTNLSKTSTTPSTTAATIVNESAKGFSDTFPLVNYTGTGFPNDVAANNLLMINQVKVVKQVDFLTYSVVSQNDPDSVITSATVQNERLMLTTANKTGKATITIRVTDRYGAFIDTTFTINVIAVPTTTVRLNNKLPKTTETLVATATPHDAAGQPVSQTFIWSVNGNIIQTRTKTGANGVPVTDTFDLSKQTGIPVGSIVTVTVTPSVGLAKGTDVSASATVSSNGAPVVNSVTLTPTSPKVTDTVVTANVVDTGANNHTVSLTYEWSVTDTSNHTTAIPSATKTTTSTTASLDLTTLAGLGITLAKGDTISVKVTPKDGSLTGSAVTKTATIADSPPVISNLTLLPDNPTSTQSVTATPTTTDADNDSVTVNFAWTVDGNSVPDTTDTLDLSTVAGVHSGSVVTVLATPNDGTLNGAAVSQSVTVAP
jgi:cyclophilin family peptidyl-prolyl cis-trans isomerase